MVRNYDVSALRDPDGRQRDASFSHRDAAGKGIERRLRGALMEKVQIVFAVWDIVELETTALLGHFEVGSLQHHDHGAHVRMDVAKNSHDAGLGELLPPRLSRRVQSDIEYFPVVVGKRVVE